MVLNSGYGKDPIEVKVKCTELGTDPFRKMRHGWLKVPRKNNKNRFSTTSALSCPESILIIQNIFDQHTTGYHF